MSVTEIHPEELFDKLVDGALSEAEHERLAQHLKVCGVCRFEYGARLDFQREAGAEHRLAPSLPLLPVQRAALPRRRRRSRVFVLGIAAAVLISASGALAAALGTKPWQALTQMFVGAPGHASSGKASVPRAAKARATNDAAAPSASVAAASPPTSATAAAMLPFAPIAATQPSASVAATSPAAASPLVVEAPIAKVRPSTSVTTVSRPERVASVKEAPASSGAPAEASGAAKLFAEANQARRAGQVGRASGLYHLLQEQHPGSSEAELSRVTLSTLLLNGGDASGALAGFERYLAGPSRVLEAEALVGRARALERLGRRQLEGAAWHEVQRRFPGSVYARQAAERLTALGQP